MTTLAMPAPRELVKAKRVVSIDLLRGAVMIIMALDHIRDYFHWNATVYDPTDLQRTTVPLFFTRWITHFCAPTFIFLAGTSAFLSGLRKTKKELSVFLFTRGLWLIFLGLTVMNFGWPFDILFHTSDFIILWALGISMIVLSPLIYLPRSLILIIALLMIFGHNLLDGITVPGNSWQSYLWSFLHVPRVEINPNHTFFIGYPVIPWVGVMAAGYCFGRLYDPDYDALKRKKWLVTMGLGAIALFIIIRAINVYGDPVRWSVQKNAVFTLLSFLNVSKYPPSLLYILMTLGPGILFLAFAENPLNRFTAKVSVFGRVPMFYYIVHVYAIHLLAIVAIVISGRSWSQMIFPTWPELDQHLRGYGFGLAIVYLIWIGLVIALYPLCKWYDEYKSRNKSKWWLSYL